MAYATRADLEGRYSATEVAQRESVLPTGALDRALADANAEIDSYLRGQYAVPLSPVPVDIVRLACAIARYRLLGEAESERARQDYEDAVRFLRDVRAGRASVADVVPLAGSGGAATVSLVNGRERAFGGSGA